MHNLLTYCPPAQIAKITIQPVIRNPQSYCHISQKKIPLKHINTQILVFTFHPGIPWTNKTSPNSHGHTETSKSRNTPHAYARALTGKNPPHETTDTLSNPGNTISSALSEVKDSDLDTFLKILDLIRKHYTKCTTNLERVKATMMIVKELESGH